MSQSGRLFDGTVLGDIETLTGNSGGAVGADSAYNVNVVGTATNGINITGNPGTHTLTVGMNSPFSGVFKFDPTGTATTVTDILTLENKANAASMTGTGEAILFNQYYYDAGTPAVADSGRISVVTEGNWTSTASTQDSYMSFQTALDGSVAEKLRLASTGAATVSVTAGVNAVNSLTLNNDTSNNQSRGFQSLMPNMALGDTVIGFEWGRSQTARNAALLLLTTNAVAGSEYMSINLHSVGDIIRVQGDGKTGFGINNTPSAPLDVQYAGTVTSNVDFLELTNSANAASMTGTGTGILFNQFYFDGSPAAADCGRISAVTTTNWTSTAGSQYSYLSLQSIQAGSMVEWGRIGDQTLSPSSFHSIGTAQLSGTIDTTSKWFFGNFAAPTGTTFGFSVPGVAIMSFDATNYNMGIGVGITSPSYRAHIAQVGTVSGLTDILAIENRGNAASMQYTGTGLLFRQYYYDASTPAAFNAGRIKFLTDNASVTSTASTQDTSFFIDYAIDGVLTTVVSVYNENGGTFKIGSDSGQQKGAVVLGDNLSRAEYVGMYRGQFDGTSGGGNVAILSGYDGVLINAGTAEFGSSKVLCEGFSSIGGRYVSITSTQSIVAATGITGAMLKQCIRVQGSGGAVDITANPQIVAGSDGQRLLIIGQSDTNTVQFDTGTGLRLNAAGSFVMGFGDTLDLSYDAGISLWVEVSRSNNT